jgi:hypothetical protein
MTRNEFRERVYQAFKAHWETTDLSPYTFENEKFTPPSTDLPLQPNSGQRWVRLSVKHGESIQKTLGRVGTRKFENSARVIMQIFTVPNSGMFDCDELAQGFTDTFSTDLGRNDVFGGQSAYRERGTANGWQMAEASADFTYDEVR